jgi:hypothetical protein
LRNTSSPFCSSYFGDGRGVSWTVFPGWPWIVILLISTSQVARITAMSHPHLWNSSSVFARQAL